MKNATRVYLKLNREMPIVFSICNLNISKALLNMAPERGWVVVLKLPNWVVGEVYQGPKAIMECSLNVLKWLQ